MESDAFDDLVRAFFDAKRVAVWGVEEGKTDPGRWVAGRLSRDNTTVIAVNPSFETDLEAGRASSLTQIEPPVDAVLVYVDRPQTDEAVNDCLAAGTPLVWLHDAMSPGSATPDAIERLTASGARVIPGLCPMLLLKPVDPAHFCLRGILRLTGKFRRVRADTRPSP